MKQLFLLLFAWIILPVNAQDKWNYSTHGKLMEIEGTEYVISSLERQSKLSTQSRELLFINSSTGEIKEMILPQQTFINKVEQIKIDSLGINRIIITTGIITKKPTWISPYQIIVCTIDGAIQESVTDSSFFLTNYIVNKHTGTIVITGYKDTNNNMRYNKSDEAQILLYSLREMKMINSY